MQLGLLVLLAVAAASSRAPLRLVLDRCPDLDQATVNRVVTTELGAALSDGGQGDALTTATAECAERQVRLTIDDPVTGKSTTRIVDLAGQPRGLGSRLLGLAISEAVLASWIELQLQPAPPAPPSDAVASLASRREAAHITERRLQIGSQAQTNGAWEIVAGPTARWFSSSLLTLGLAGGGRRWFDRHPSAGFGLELEGSYGQHSVPKVVRGTATGISFAPCLLMRSSFGRFSIAAGTGARVAWTRLSAEPAGLRPGGAGWSLWTGPFLAADLSVPLSGAFFLRAGVEIGYVLVPAHGRLGPGEGSTKVIELDGAWMSGTVSLATTL